MLTAIGFKVLDGHTLIRREGDVLNRPLVVARFRPHRLVLVGDEVRIRQRLAGVAAMAVDRLAAVVLRGAAQNERIVDRLREVDRLAVNRTIRAVQHILRLRRRDVHHLAVHVGGRRKRLRLARGRIAERARIDRQQLCDARFERAARGRSRRGLLRRVHRLDAVVARLLRLDVRRRVGDLQRNVVRRLARPAVAEEDVAVRADRARKRAARHLGRLRARAAVDEAKRRGELLPAADVAAVRERAVLDRNRLRAVRLVVDVERNLAAREGAVHRLDRAVRVRVDGGRLREEVAVRERDVVDARRARDVDALDIRLALKGLAVTVGQVDRHLVGRVTLAPHAEVVQFVGRDRNVLVEAHAVRRLLARRAAERVGVDFQIAFATRKVGVVAVDREIVRDVSVGHFADIRARTADNRDRARIRLVRRRQRFRQRLRLRVAALRTRRPVDRRCRVPGGILQERERVVLGGERRTRLGNRHIRRLADLGDKRLQNLYTVIFHPGEARRRRKFNTRLLGDRRRVAIHRQGARARNRQTVHVDRPALRVNRIRVGDDGCTFYIDHTALDIDGLRRRMVQRGVAGDGHRSRRIHHERRIGGCCRIEDIRSVNRERTAIVRDDVLSRPFRHARRVAVDVDALDGHRRVLVVVKDRPLAGVVANALDRALRARGAIHDFQRAVVADDVGADFRPVAMRRAGVLLDRVAVQVEDDLLPRLDDETCNALVRGRHMVIRTVDQTLFLRLPRHKRIPMVRILRRRVNTDLVAVKRIARGIVVEFLGAEVLGRVQRLQRDVRAKLDRHRRAVRRGLVKCLAEGLLIVAELYHLPRRLVNRHTLGKEGLHRRHIRRGERSARHCDIRVLGRGRRTERALAARQCQRPTADRDVLGTTVAPRADDGTVLPTRQCQRPTADRDVLGTTVAPRADDGTVQPARQLQRPTTDRDIAGLASDIAVRRRIVRTAARTDGRTVLPARRRNRAALDFDVANRFLVAATNRGGILPHRGRQASGLAVFILNDQQPRTDLAERCRTRTRRAADDIFTVQLNPERRALGNVQHNRRARVLDAVQYERRLYAARHGHADRVLRVGGCLLDRIDPAVSKADFYTRRIEVIFKRSLAQHIPILSLDERLPRRILHGGVLGKCREATSENLKRVFSRVSAGRDSTLEHATVDCHYGILHGRNVLGNREIVAVCAGTFTDGEPLGAIDE